jgi:hypothetical protein
MAFNTLLRTVQLLFVVGLLCSSAQSRIVVGHRRHHDVTNVYTLSRRQNTTAAFYPVLGIAGLGVDTTQPRLEIRELQRNPDLFNLYLLGLQRWQSTNQDDKLSYFQVAGVKKTFVRCITLLQSSNELTTFRYPRPTFLTMGRRRRTHTATRRLQRRLLSSQQ